MSIIQTMLNNLMVHTQTLFNGGQWHRKQKQLVPNWTVFSDPLFKWCRIQLQHKLLQLIQAVCLFASIDGVCVCNLLFSYEIFLVQKKRMQSLACFFRHVFFLCFDSVLSSPFLLRLIGFGVARGLAFEGIPFFVKQIGCLLKSNFHEVGG